MAIQNRLTKLLGIAHPVLLAPMDLVSGGRLAAAVTQAGGLGLLGGGYGDGDWIDRECESRRWTAPLPTNPPPSCSLLKRFRSNYN
jgi:NAD(P)H-dependent flavin oxidoreductase YrpB (nitropropane dioxygenase family)